jgi:hypothetical protein
MSTRPVHGVRPDAVPGWWLDHRLGEAAGCPVYAARRAMVHPGTPPEYASILLARGDEPARAALGALGGPTPSDALPLTAAGAPVALVLPANVVPTPESGRASEPEPEPGRASEPGPATAPPSSPCPASVVPPAPPLAGRMRRRAVMIGATGLALLVALGLAARDRPGAGAATDDAAVGWDAATATVTVVRDGETRQFVVGAPGDQLLLGDWDGDRVRTPGLYRGATGELWVFDRWAAEGEPAGARPLERRTPLGTARVVRRGDRDTIVVDTSPG